MGSPGGGGLAQGLGTRPGHGGGMVSAEGGPKIFKPKSSWHRRRRSKILAVSLKHWKGRGGVRGFQAGGGVPPLLGRSSTSLGVPPGLSPAHAPYSEGTPCPDLPALPSVTVPVSRLCIEYTRRRATIPTIGQAGGGLPFFNGGSRALEGRGLGWGA